MKRLFVLPVMAIIFSVALVFLSALTAFATESVSDAELIEKLVTGSPWKGTWELIPYNGQLELVLTKKDGKLDGVIQNGTGSPRSFDGPMKYLKVGSGTVEFQSVTGADYRLRLDKDGNLTGTVFSSLTKRDGKVFLTPTKKE